MKAVILAGGYGTRISEESRMKPKPMVEIGSHPLLWHVMRIYYRFGVKEFIICTGYRGDMINEYFCNYFFMNNNITLDFANSSAVQVHEATTEDWKVTIVNTGLNTMTGGRVKRIAPYIGNEPFFLTYGDGVSDVDIAKLLAYHSKSDNIVTVTAVKPQGRFGILNITEQGKVERFAEKSRQDVDWINGGFMVAEPELFSYIGGDDTILEREPFEALVKQQKMGAYRHDGFWHCVDTMRDKKALEEYIQVNQVPWLD